MRISTIGAWEIDSYYRNGNCILIDVRDRNEYEKKHICNAVNIPLNDIKNGAADNFGWDKQKVELVIYCERGGNSLIAASTLQRQGYRVKSVVGGINAYRGRLICND